MELEHSAASRAAGSGEANSSGARSGSTRSGSAGSGRAGSGRAGSGETESGGTGSGGTGSDSTGAGGTSPADDRAAGRASGDQAAGDPLALSQSIEELDLPLRAYNSLRRDGLHTVGDLVALTSEQLLALDNIGPASVAEIRHRLADHGLSLRPDDGDALAPAEPGTRDPAADTAGPSTPEPDTLVPDTLTSGLPVPDVTEADPGADDRAGPAAGEPDTLVPDTLTSGLPVPGTTQAATDDGAGPGATSGTGGTTDAGRSGGSPSGDRIAQGQSAGTQPADREPAAAGRQAGSVAALPSRRGGGVLDRLRVAGRSLPRQARPAAGLAALVLIALGVRRWQSRRR